MSDSIDWDHFATYAGRAAGRIPIVGLLFASLGLGFASLHESSPEAAQELMESLTLVSLWGVDVHALLLLMFMAACWVTLPFVTALLAFPRLNRVLGS